MTHQHDFATVCVYRSLRIKTKNYGKSPPGGHFASLVHGRYIILQTHHYHVSFSFGHLCPVSKLAQKDMTTHGRRVNPCLTTTPRPRSVATYLPPVPDEEAGTRAPSSSSSEMIDDASMWIEDYGDVDQNHPRQHQPPQPVPQTSLSTRIASAYAKTTDFSAYDIQYFHPNHSINRNLLIN